VSGWRFGDGEHQESGKGKRQLHHHITLGCLHCRRDVRVTRIFQLGHGLQLVEQQRGEVDGCQVGEPREAFGPSATVDLPRQKSMDSQLARLQGDGCI